MDLGIDISYLRIYIYIDLHEFQVLEMHERQNTSYDFFSLAMGPSYEVCSYSWCIVGGVEFHTIEHDSRCTTQNSGVMVVDENSANGSANNNFYDVLDKVLDVQYPMGRHVWLSKCR